MPADFANCRLTAVKLAETTAPQTRVAFSRAFCAQAIAAYWTDIAARYPNGRPIRRCPIDLSSLDSGVTDLALRAGMSVASLPEELSPLCQHEMRPPPPRD